MVASIAWVDCWVLWWLRMWTAGCFTGFGVSVVLLCLLFVVGGVLGLLCLDLCFGG